ncbi:hypothetical protein C0Z18_02855 [Trinickia dabaoshanensis]|uniref:ABC-type transport auxiliary lipoprotein component domain-containing protein n=1 Tax=Trinickia dabaoshanensis TaxID=564714 RepID=A0A2N7W199_9BURK|nr:PqiC family protein [Trinickia dabaoshanensis]PMS23162.1 hypothetical protein C0Z18_02855 [Trinickia dabaoshanensis]
MKRHRFAPRRRPLASIGAYAACAAWLGAALLSGCASSPSSRFYTLGGPSQTERAPTAPAAKPPAFLIEVPAVDVPAQVARNQLVVSESATRVDVLEQERWASLPADEIRRALSADLAAQLGTFDVFGSPHPENVPVYRISVNVSRLESWPGSRTVLDSVWSVRSLRTQTLVTCHTVQRETVGAGYDALVAGHRRAVGELSDSIASVVRALASGARAPAPGGLDCSTGSSGTEASHGTP